MILLKHSCYCVTKYELIQKEYNHYNGKNEPLDGTADENVIWYCSLNEYPRVFQWDVSKTWFQDSARVCCMSRSVKVFTETLHVNHELGLIYVTNHPVSQWKNKLLICNSQCIPNIAWLLRGYLFHQCFSFCIIFEQKNTKEQYKGKVDLICTTSSYCFCWHAWNM